MSVSLRPVVTLCFRFNGYYEYLMPVCEHALKEQGFAVRWLTVPQEASEAEVREELRDLVKYLKDSIIFCDLTCGRHLPLSRADLKREQSTIAGTIDEIITQADLPLLIAKYGITIAEEEQTSGDSRSGDMTTVVPVNGNQTVLPETHLGSVWANDLKPSRKLMNFYGGCVTALLKEALNNEEKPLSPHFVIIVPLLVHHDPFLKFYYALFRQHAQRYGDGYAGIWMKMFDAMEMNSSFYSSIFDSRVLGRFANRISRTLRQPHQELVNWIVAAGVPRDYIHIVTGYEDLAKIDWSRRDLTFIADRHFFRDWKDILSKAGWGMESIGKVDDGLKNNTILKLPLENLRESLLRQDFIKITPEEDQARLARIQDLVVAQALTAEAALKEEEEP